MDETIESWRGCSMDEIHRYLNAFELKHVEDVRVSENHVVLYQFPIRQIGIPPKPYHGNCKWDSHHVRIPCSVKSQYPVTNENGNTTIESRWEMIKKALLSSITNSHELENAILSYNSKYKEVWKFRSLHQFFKEIDDEEADLFFKELLPKITQLALRLPELIMASIPLLKQSENKSISLSQQQISCLLANAFLCTYPRRNTMKRKSEYSSFPDINFNRLFQSSGDHVLEKLKCIFHYFQRVCNNPPTGVVTFTRRSKRVEDLPNWSSCDVPLGITPLHVTSVGTIEDQGTGLLQVDFANKFLGGGVLGSGCVQEEIRFVICPELIISKLFTEALRPCEALMIIGAEQFSKYSGYASSFLWDGNFSDSTPVDESCRKQCHIVAIDALHFVQSDHQFREELMLRELNKAYVGFFHILDTLAPGVASGNWGCGAFGGEPTLKALIQLMVCTITKRPLAYFTFGDEILRDEIHQMHTFFIEENVKVKDLWFYLKQFRKHKLQSEDLFEFVRKCHLGNTPVATCSSSVRSDTLNTPTKKRFRTVEQRENININRAKTLTKCDHNPDLEYANVKKMFEPQISNDSFSMESNSIEETFRDVSTNTDENMKTAENLAKKVKKSSVHSEQQTNVTNVVTNTNLVSKQVEKKDSKSKTLIDMLDFFYKKS